MSATSSIRPVRRTARRAALVLGAGLVTSAALTGAAYAHVEITPGSVPGGEDAVIAFSVPTESDSASTVAVKVLLPRNKPIAEVATTPMPGWTATTTTRTLARPIQVEGEKLTSVVSQVTWRATGAGIAPGQYQQFALSLGPLPDSGTLVFNAVQTYSDGTVVSWNEVSADKSVEAEHPAPTLSLTSAESDSGTPSGTTSEPASPTGTAATTPTATTPADNNGSGSTWATLMAGAALVVSLLTALLVWRRGSPVPVATGGSSSRDLEDTRA
jgi:periplasmic copper chaperone A